MQFNSFVLTALIVFSQVAFAQEPREQGVLFTNVMVWDGTSEGLRKADVLVARINLHRALGGTWPGSLTLTETTQ